MKKCNVCGAPLAPGSSFCTYCGSAQAKKGSGLWSILIGVGAGLLVAAILLLTGVAHFGGGEAASAFRTTGKGCDSPEDAVQAYVSRMQALDVDGTAALYRADNDSDENIAMQYVGVVRLDVTPCVGGSFAADLGRPMNAWIRVSRGLLRNYFTVAAERAGRDSWYDMAGYNRNRDRVPTSRDEEAREALMAYLSDPTLQSAFANMQLRSVTTLATDRDSELLDRYRGYYGASGYVVCLAELEIDGESYELLVETVCQNGRWYLVGNGLTESIYKPRDYARTLYS